jgi:CBS domain-containing protein
MRNLLAQHLAKMLRVSGCRWPVRLHGTPRAWASCMQTQKRLVGQVMTRDVATLGRNEKLVVADDLMKLGRVRHLPIVDDDGTLAGIVTQRDLFHSGLLRALGYGTHARHEVLDSTLVKEAMRTEVCTTTPDTPLAVAAKIMLERKIGCLVVLSEGKIAGILTESDFVKLALED